MPKLNIAKSAKPVSPALVSAAKPVPVKRNIKAGAKAAATISTVAVNAAIAKAGTSSNVADTKRSTLPIEHQLTTTATVATVPTTKRTSSNIERFEHRDAAFLLRAKYPSGPYSDLDAQYLGFFSRFLKSSKAGIANVAAIDTYCVDNNVRAGAESSLNNRCRLHRLVGSGHLRYIQPDGRASEARSIHFAAVTDKCATLAVYSTAKPIA